MIEENTIKEFFIERFALAIKDLSKRYVFIKTKNGFEYFGLFELIASNVELVAELGKEIFVKTYKKALSKN